MRFATALLIATFLGTAAEAQDVITPENVSRLKIAWTYDTGDSTEPMGRYGRRPRFEATPVYDAGRLFLSTPAGTVVALDAERGTEIWKVNLRVEPNGNYGDFANRGVAIRDGQLFIATVDARLICLGAGDGKPCPKFGKDGAVDLTVGLRRKPQWLGEYSVTSPPAIYRDLIITGAAIADNSRANMASGEVRAFDAATGALRWTFYPLPENSPAGGANTWSRIVVDEAQGLVFLPTGSASPDYFGGERPGDNRHANSMVALNASTGEVVWAFQTVHHDIWDYDVASPPLLYPSRYGPAVAVGSKTGHLFLFQRATGKPIFPVEERKVPVSDVPGEKASETQPFPTKPASLVPHAVKESELWGANEEELQGCRETFRRLRNEGIFTPPSLRGSLIVPGNIGGLHWGGAAYDAAHGLIIAPVNRLPAIIRLIPRDQFRSEKKAHPEQEITEQDGTAFSMSRQFFLSAKGKPCIAPPWGELVAVRADSGDIAWRVPLGDLSDGPSPQTGSPNLGGPLTTATGLVFIGAALDPYVRAFETGQGREVWKGKLPTSARATPMLYTTSRGRQMLAIAAGGHDSPFSRLDTKLVVFSLDGR